MTKRKAIKHEEYLWQKIPGCLDFVQCWTRRFFLVFCCLHCRGSSKHVADNGNTLSKAAKLLCFSSLMSY